MSIGWRLGFGIFVCLLVGFCAAVFILNAQYLTFDKIITGGNVLQSLSTIVAAIIVAVYFQRLVQLDRKEKDLILAQLDSLTELLIELNDLESPIELIKVAIILKRISTKWELISKGMAECNYKLEDDNKVIVLAIQNVRIQATETPPRAMTDFAATTECPISVREGIINWTANHKRELEARIDKLEGYIFKLQIKINRL